MTSLPPNTLRRLKKLPQNNSVWEGDYRKLSGVNSELEPDPDAEGECIIWVDGSEGMVRAVDFFSSEMGLEAVVRTLLRAIEHPHSAAQPCLPQKIVVKDRQLQFFLRGVLQDLNINIEYVPQLPLLDELFRDFESIANAKTPVIPQQYRKKLKETAQKIWEIAPWEVLGDNEIISLDIEYGDVRTLYACFLGMLEKEYGIILYRSLESLKEFRRAALMEKSVEAMEKAFLSQDCWFLNYEPKSHPSDEFDDAKGMLRARDLDLGELSATKIEPIFGSLHPLEGIRPFLDEEEAIAIYAALKGIEHFWNDFEAQLAEENVELQKSYKISLPKVENLPQSISIKVSTLPALNEELWMMEEELGDDDEDGDEFYDYDNENEDWDWEEEGESIQIAIGSDLIPPKSIISIGSISGETIKTLQQSDDVYCQTPKKFLISKNMPVAIVQTTRPKAKILLEDLRAEGGIRSVCFQVAPDDRGDMYNFGVLQTANSNLHLLARYNLLRQPNHFTEMKQWQEGYDRSKGYCAFIVATGASGSSKKKPQLKDMVGLFIAKVVTVEELSEAPIKNS
jgi:hypothetical protein